MSDPPSLTDSELISLTYSTTSGISDNFFLRCNLLPIPYLNGFIKSVLSWISFYFIGDTLIFLLLLLPVIFSLQTSGKQKKLLQLYNKIRLYLLKFLTLCNFSISISAILGWAIGVHSPCLESVSSELPSFGYMYQSPAVNVVLGAACSYFMIANGNTVKKNKESWYDRYFMKILAIIIALFFSFTDIIYGKCSVIQALFSLSIGYFMSISVDLLPIIAIIIIELCFIVLLCLCMRFNTLSNIKAELNDNYWSLCFDGISYLVSTIYLLFRFVQTRCEVRFQSKFNKYLEEQKSVETSHSEAIFGELDSASEKEVDDYSLALKRDLRDSAFAIIVKLAIEFVSVFILEFLGYGE